MPVPIPNVDRKDLAKWCGELGFKRIVEIGVKAGDYTKVLCEANPQATVYGVDPWVKYPGYMDGSPINREDWFNSQLGKAVQRLSRYRNCRLLRKFSMEAVREFDAESVDMVYIDGNHGFENVTQDIEMWESRVRPGGIVAGHDYKPMKVPHERIEVVEAVNKYTAAHGISPWFVLGARQSHPGMVREDIRSWMWIKS